MRRVLQFVNAFLEPLQRAEQPLAGLLRRTHADQSRVTRAKRRHRRLGAQRMVHGRSLGDFREAVDGAPMEIGRGQHGQKAEHRKYPRDKEDHIVGALHRLQFLRALRGEGLVDVGQLGAQRLGIPRRGGIGLRAVVLDGELGGVKLFLKLQEAAQDVLGIRVLGHPRECRRRDRFGPPTRRGQGDQH